MTAQRVLAVDLTPEEVRWLLYAVNKAAAEEAAWPVEDGRREAFNVVLKKLRGGVT